MTSFSDYFALPQVPNADGTVKTAYGESDTGADEGYASLPFMVGPYDLLTIKVELTGLAALTQLDLQLLASPRPEFFDPLNNPVANGPTLDPSVGADYTTATGQGLPRPEEMDVPLLPSDLGQDLEWSITNVLSRSSGGALTRLFTIDVTAFSLICLRAKGDAAEGNLTLSILPNMSGQNAPRGAASLGY